MKLKKRVASLLLALSVTLGSCFDVNSWGLLNISAKAETDPESISLLMDTHCSAGGTYEQQVTTPNGTITVYPQAKCQHGLGYHHWYHAETNIISTLSREATDDPPTVTLYKFQVVNNTGIDVVLETPIEYAYQGVYVPAEEYRSRDITVTSPIHSVIRITDDTQTLSKYYDTASFTINTTASSLTLDPISGPVFTSNSSGVALTKSHTATKCPDGKMVVTGDHKNMTTVKTEKGDYYDENGKVIGGWSKTYYECTSCGADWSGGGGGLTGDNSDYEGDIYNEYGDLVGSVVTGSAMTGIKDWYDEHGNKVSNPLSLMRPASGLSGDVSVSSACFTYTFTTCADHNYTGPHYHCDTHDYVGTSDACKYNANGDAAYSLSGINYSGNTSKIYAAPITIALLDDTVDAYSNYINAVSDTDIVLTLTDRPARWKYEISTESGVIIDSGTSEADTLSFKMVNEPVTVALEIALIHPTNTYPTSIQKTYGDVVSSVGFITDSDGEITYSSSDPQVVDVDPNGELTVIKPGTATITITTAETGNYFASASTIDVVVDKATPLITNGPFVSELTYGQALSDSNITGDVNVAGVFEWVDDTIKPTVSDSDVMLYGIVFVPDEHTYYNSITGLSSTVTVHKADAVDGLIGTPSASDIVYGQTLADSTITQAIDATVTGRFEWQDPSIVPKASDSNNTQYNVTFTPDDTANYNVRNDILLTLTVSKAMPVVSGTFTASDITYGNTLSNSIIDTSGITTDVTGRFEWETPDYKPVATTGTDYNVVFIPDDENYATVSGLTANVVVNKAVYRPSEEELAALSSTPITYGDTLEQSTLSSSIISAVAGHYEWADKTIVPAVRDSLLTEYDVVFIPDDVDNYDITTGLRSTVQVNKADYVPTADELASVTVSDLVYEQLLGNSVITSTFVTDGSFTWEDPTIKPTVADSDTTPYNVIFTDNDGNYNPYAIPTTVHVDKKQLSAADFEELHATGIYYGQSLAKSIITCTNDVCDGVFTWQDDSIMPTVADSNTTPYLFDFIPVDTDNYEVVTGMSLTVTVSQANPLVSIEVIDGLTATAITYGQSLFESAITSSALPSSPTDPTVSISGHWEWVNGDTIYPTVADSDRTEYDIVFIPDDSDSYVIITGIKLTLSVNKADYILSDSELASIKASDITYGQTLSSSTITGVIGIAGRFEWIAPDTEPELSDSDKTAFGVIYVASDPNYNDITDLSAMLTIKKKAAAVDPNNVGAVVDTIPHFNISATPIYVGQSLADSVLSADININGTLTWMSPSIKPTFADSNKTEYVVVYKPAGNYSISYTMKTTVTVNKNVPNLIPENCEIDEQGRVVIRKTYGDPDFRLDIHSNNVADLVFTYADDVTNDTISVNDEGVVHIKNAGEEDIVVEFTGDDYWADATLIVRVIVARQTPVIPDDVILSISTTPITYGDSLSKSTIRVDGVEIDGYFTWEDTGIIPELSDSDVTEYTLVFHPYDIRNYSEIRLYKATVTVNAAENDIPILPPDEPIDSTPIENEPVAIPVVPDMTDKADDESEEDSEDELSVDDNPYTGNATSTTPFMFGFMSLGAMLVALFTGKRKKS